MRPEFPGDGGGPVPEGGRTAEREAGVPDRDSGAGSESGAGWPQPRAAQRESGTSWLSADAQQHPNHVDHAGSAHHAASVPPRRGRGYRLILTALVLSLLGAAASLTAVVTHVLPRSFSAAQQQQISAWEIGKRWRTWPAGELFPASVSYQLTATVLQSGTGIGLVARRIGIAPQSSCASATDPVASRVLAKHGCRAVLRATYRDSTGTFAVTVGIAVLPSPAMASGAAGELPDGSGLKPGVRAVGFHGTLTAAFNDPARQLSAVSARGPYVIMTAVGYADGRHRVHESADPYDKNEMIGVSDGIADRIGAALAAPPPPAQCPGGPAC